MKEVSDVPVELKPVIEEHLKRVEHLLPRWVERVRVQYVSTSDSERQSSASVFIQEEYRCVELSIHPMWFHMPDWERHYTLVHEISHVPNTELQHLAESLIEHCVTDESAAAVLQAQLRKAVEAATEDTANMILRTEELNESA